MLREKKDDNFFSQKFGHYFSGDKRKKANKRWRPWATTRRRTSRCGRLRRCAAADYEVFFFVGVFFVFSFSLSLVMVLFDDDDDDVFLKAPR